MKGKMNVHWKQIFKSDMYYHLQRVLRDKGAMNKEVGDAFEFAFEEVAKDYAIAPIKTPKRTDLSELDEERSFKGPDLNYDFHEGKGEDNELL